MRRITTTTQQQPGAAVVVCLQAQHVAGLPAAAEGRQVLLSLPATGAVAAAAALCRGGVAAFHHQVLLLDYYCDAAPPVGIVGVAVAVADGRRHQHDQPVAAVDVNLEEQLRRPSPRVLSFVIGGGAVLSLTLHHRLVVRRRHSSVCNCKCMAAADRLLSCLRPAGGAGGVGRKVEDDEESSSSSSGFITIEKGTISISRRRPPSDNMPTTTDDEVEEEDGRKVEDEFLAMLDADDDLLFDLDALIKDAEAERDRELPS